MDPYSAWSCSTNLTLSLVPVVLCASPSPPLTSLLLQLQILFLCISPIIPEQIYPFIKDKCDYLAPSCSRPASPPRCLADNCLLLSALTDLF